jgi:arylsulfatase A-like enzyme
MKPITGFLLCLSLVVFVPAASSNPTTRPNVLFIAVDDLRPELGCYGADHVISPGIDRIARAGMVFGRAYCQQAVCSPSRSSLMTGARPDTTRVWDLETHFRKAMPDVVTLGQHFKQNISYVDARIGRILDQLEHLGLGDNTIVILWGDHGWKLGEHDAWCKHSNMENDTHSPLLLSAPGMPSPGSRSDALVEFVDIYPTLCELAGLPLPAHLEGTSFKPLLDNPARPWKSAAFSQYPRSADGTSLMGYSMRTDRHRLTLWVERRNRSKVRATELYDHQTDPQENRNIADKQENADLIAELTAKLRAGWKAARPQ